MTLSEIKDRLENLPRITEKIAFIEILLSEITITNRGIWSDDYFSEKAQLEGLKWSNELVHHLQNIHFELKQQQDNKSIERVFEHINFYKNQSLVLKSYLPSCLKSAMDRFDNLKFSWDYELDINVENRYLRLLNHIPFELTEKDAPFRERHKNKDDDEFEGIRQEFENFKRDYAAGNLHSVGISYAYANINLPKVYDIIFHVGDEVIFQKKKTILKYAFNYRHFFHTDLWRGHHSHCFLEIIGDVPEIFDKIPSHPKESKQLIGLSTEYDWQYVQKNVERFIKSSYA